MLDIQTLFGYLTPISLTIGVVYHIMTLQNNRKTQQLSLKAQEQALETRQAQLFQDIYNEYRNKEFQRRMSTIYNIWEWKDYDDFEEKYGRNVNPEDYSSWVSVNAFFNGMGVLVNRKLLDINLVSEMLSGVIIRLWEKNEPIIKEMRKRRNWPKMTWGFEQLYEAIKNIELNESHY